MISPKVLALTVAVGLVTSHCPAAVLVYEGFDGYAPGNIHGQTANANTVGLDTSGSSGNYASSSSNIVYQSTGLTFGDLQVSGGSIRLQSATGTLLGVGLNAGTVTGTLYTSYLVNFSNKPQFDTTPYAYTAIAASPGTSSNHAFAAVADNTGANKVAVGYDGTGGSATNAGQYLSSSGATFLVIAEFTNVGESLSVDTPGEATLWVLTAAQFANFELSGLSVAALNSASIGTGASNVFTRVSDTQTSGTYNFDNSLYLQIGLNSNSSTQNYTLDEIRYGTTFGDVLPIPEPSGVAMLVLGMGMAGILRGGKMRFCQRV